MHPRKDDFLNKVTIFEGLNEAQLKAVTYAKGPLLIIAGAGFRKKTKTLTHRIAYLLEIEKIPFWQILAITFTNKAADEMKERLGQAYWTYGK